MRKKKKPDPLLMLINALITGALSAGVLAAAEWPDYRAIIVIGTIILGPVQGALKSWLGEEEPVLPRRLPPADGSDR